MTNYLDREGIFKARPVSWVVKTFPNSRSVAIAIDFVVTAQLDGSEWQDWSAYDEVRVRGDYFVVKKTGEPNLVTIQQLAESMGWGGSLGQVHGESPPLVIVQIQVKEEVYNGKSFFKACWMNPGDYVPTGGGADEDAVKQLDAQFGSLLRAAAGSKVPKAGVKAPPPPAAKPKPAPAPEAQPAPAPKTVAEVNPSEIPF